MIPRLDNLPFFLAKNIVRKGMFSSISTCNEIELNEFVFRINNDFSFDEAVVKYYGCEVHSFDPR